MNKPRKARKCGPLLWQLKLRLKRMERRLDADLSAMRAKLAVTEAAPEDMNAEDISQVNVAWAEFGVTRESIDPAALIASEMQSRKLADQCLSAPEAQRPSPNGPAPTEGPAL